MRFEEYWSQSVGTKTSAIWVDQVFLYTGMTTVYISFDTIESMKRVTENTFTVTLLSGDTLEGDLGKYDDGIVRSFTVFKGTTTVHGYPSEWEITLASVTSLTFARDEEGAILADVTTEDGSTTQVSEPQFRRTASSPFSGYSPRTFVEFVIGNSTLQIPLEDIDKIEIGEEAEETTLTLRTGEELVGRIAFGFLSGKTTVIGLPAYFFAHFASEIRSVVFH